MKNLINKIKQAWNKFCITVKDLEAIQYADKIVRDDVKLPCIVYEGINIIYDTRLCFGIRKISMGVTKYNGYAIPSIKTIILPTQEDLSEFPKETIDFLLGHEIGHIKLEHNMTDSIRLLENEIAADAYAVSLNGLEQTKFAMNYVMLNLLDNDVDREEFRVRILALK